MPRRTHRRDFLKTSAAVGAGVLAARSLRAADKESPNERIQFACIGVGGKGSSDSADAGNFGDVVAICDIDALKLEAASERFPNAEMFFDYREMLDKMGDKIDAVTVSTPDHTHAPASIKAMRMGKHCFTQKPLTHSLYEARLMGQVAKEMGVATQMGNQGTSLDGLRKAAAMVKKGVIGDVKEVHVWTNRPIWPQGEGRPSEETPPETVKWDLWLGPAAERPYAKGYHPFAWRGWWDFGTGALGDMACHTMNLPFQTLDLRDPLSVQAKTSGHNGDSYPKQSKITFEFPANDSRGPVTLVWYDGGELPDSALFDGKTPKNSGSLMIGSEGKLYSPDDYGAEYYVLGGPQEIDVEYRKSPGHFDEWVAAIKGGEPAMSAFAEYSGPLTETVLLGNLAVWANGKKIEWDAKSQTATNAPEVAAIIHPEFREGWKI